MTNEPLWALRQALAHDSLCRGGAGELHFDLPYLPKSLNHQYVVRGRAVRDFDPAIKKLRDDLRVKLLRCSWCPRGVLGVVIVFHSPKWITKKNTIRDVDIDNKVKPLMDAFEKATGIRDSRVWSVHAFKALSELDRTEVSIYDLGAIVRR